MTSGPHVSYNRHIFALSRLTEILCSSISILHAKFLKNEIQPSNLKVIAHYIVTPQQSFTFIYIFPSSTFKPKAMWKYSRISCLLPYYTNHPLPTPSPGQMSPMSHTCYSVPHCCVETGQSGHSNHCSNPALKAINANLQIPPKLHYFNFLKQDTY